MQAIYNKNLLSAFTKQHCSCPNITQSHLSHLWTVVCVNDPQFNDIARELHKNGAWESWLSSHLVKGMLNYPTAVLLGT